MTTETVDPVFAELQALYPKMVDRVMKAGQGNIDLTFLGFLDTYRALATIIPRGRTVIDLGCCYAFQSWFFKDHKDIGVDVISRTHRISLPGHKHYQLTIKDFYEAPASYITGPTFAICNYVPPWYGGSEEHVRKRFTDLFVYYPQHGDHPEEEERISAAMNRKTGNP